MIHPDIHLWTYVDDPRNYRGFDLSADDAGCDVLLRRINAIQAGDGPSRLRFELTSLGPRELAVVGYGGRARKFTRWVTNYATESADIWAFTTIGRCVILSLGRDSLWFWWRI